MDYFSNKSILADNLVFQGSNDGFSSDINDLVTVGEEIHEGWNSYDLPMSTYSSFRIFNAENNGCNSIGELKLFGQKVYDVTTNNADCPVFIFDAVNIAPLATISQTITYDLSVTSYVQNISPRFGSVEGNTDLTISVTDIATSNPNDVTVTIDGVTCAITDVLPTLIRCTTGPRIGLYLDEPRLDIIVAGRGKVDTNEKVYRYVSLWSQTSTWGGQFAPVDGESVAVPKGLNLLVDIDTSPMLNMVLVDGGSIIFPSESDPNHQRNFDAKVIFINNGVFEAGTEDEPYTSKLTITMHGKKYDPTVPIYGNKVLGARYSTVDMHGAARTSSWTRLDATVASGATSITLVDEVDWKAGEMIMITSTDFDRNQAEQHEIDSVSNAGGKTTIVLKTALAHEHYAALQTYGTDSVEIRAEVALM